MDGFHCGAEFAGAGRLEQVAGGSGADQIEDGVVCTLAGKDDNAGGGGALTDETGGFDAIDKGHFDFKDGYIGVMPVDKPEQLFAVVRKAEEGELLFFIQDGGEAMQVDRVDVGQNKADRSIHL